PRGGAGHGAAFAAGGVIAVRTPHRNSSPPAAASGSHGATATSASTSHSPIHRSQPTESPKAAATRPPNVGGGGARRRGPGGPTPPRPPPRTRRPPAAAGGTHGATATSPTPSHSPIHRSQPTESPKAAATRPPNVGGAATVGGT